ncbi:hypothetical protein SDC9_52645 [bioreactor metagenome]|uniref:HNH nuclease domain-containing protein n=1 Tax=bioreactor metagenome TaxID=1076179 RepID=A0A644WR20_9ZZZZ
MKIYVISKNGKPLMPTTPARARKMLRDGKAKCIRRTPFTIKLLYETTSYTQSITLGVDTGSSHVGSAAVDSAGSVVYLSETEIRNDIADKMKQRAKYRRNRRNRKTRYRQARWLNRKNSIKSDRFSPTMISKINSHLKEISFAKSLLPIAHMILETGTFDPHALKNPDVLKNKWLYQRGANYGFANTKAFVLDRDSYTCQNCKGKTKDSRLEVHHIVFRSNGGSDEAENLMTLCKTCHDKVHSGAIKLKVGKSKGQLKHATQMNSIRNQLLRLVPESEETFGYITKEHRQLMSLPKEHFLDAVAIAALDNIRNTGLISVNFQTSLLRKKCVSDGDYQQSKGVRSEQPIQTGKIIGYRKFDKVKYLDGEYFIKGRMSTGYAILMDINGNKVPLKPIPKFDKMQRLSARKSWIIQQETIQNIA